MIKRYRLARPPDGWPEQVPFRVHLGEGKTGPSYGVGDEFEHEFDEDGEAANLASGLIEMVEEEVSV